VAGADAVPGLVRISGLKHLMVDGFRNEVQLRRVGVKIMHNLST